MAIAVIFHLLAVVLWVGGMFFAHQCLRPVAAAQLQPPERLRLWSGVFGRFFPWVWVAIITILVTGLWMILVPFGGFKHAALYIHLMFGLGLVMMAIFMHVFFVPFKRLKMAVAAENWPEGGKHLAQIRQLVGINIIIGVITILVGAGGRYLIPGAG